MGLTAARRPWRAFVAGAALMKSVAAIAAAIVADGGTATTVSTSLSGRQTVNIAPAVAGVSHNTYVEFNVGKAGAELNNVGVNARNIVNQVTSTNPSLIQGDITVLGPRANVILANPNGITVNGGSFVNTGNVAITTGQVSFNDIVISPGNTQRNIVLNTSQGSIEIGPDGLSGAMLDLELIAKNIIVNGAVLNTVGNNAAKIRAVAGASHSEIDGSVSPTDLISTWIGHTSPGGSNAGVTALDITPLGSLTAGRIELIITEQGAGVRHAGAIYANVGDFTIAGNGDLHVDGGRVEAVNDVIVANATLTGQRVDAGMPVIKAGRTVDIRAGAIGLADITINAGQRTVDAGGNIIVSQRGNILMGTDGVAGTAAFTFSDSTFDATGGIGLFNSTQQIQMNASQLTAEQDVVLKGGNVSMLSKWNGHTGSQSSGSRSSLTSKTGTVSITATGALQLSGATINGAAGLNVIASQISAAALRSADGSAIYKSSLQSSAGSIVINTVAGINLLGSDLFAANNIVTQSAGFDSRDDSGVRSTLIALTGGVLIDSAGDINNVGSLIQGNARIAGNAASLGAITLKAAGGILNESPSEAALAAIFGVNDDVVLQASADVINHHARIIANTSLAITAGGNVQNIIDKQAGANGEQGLAYQTTDSRWLLLSQRNSGFDIDYGRVAMPNQLAYLVAENGMTIQAANFLNRGGIALVNNGNMTINASNTFRNEALFDGQAHYQRRCLIFCSSSASSDISSHGGILSASADIVIQAGVEAANIGGSVLALGNLTVTAPRVYAQGVAGYRAYNQADFKTWFGSAWGRLYATDTGGSWFSGGKLTLNGQGVIDGGSFAALTELIANNGMLTIRSPQRDPVSIERNIGFGSALW